MIYLIDIDGVCASLVQYILDRCAPDLSPSQMTQFHFFDLLPNSKHAYELLDNPQTWRNLEPYAQARRSIELHQRLGRRVVFVSKPWEGCPQWAHERKAWIRKHLDPKPKVIWTKHKELVMGDVFIDDRPEHVISWQLMNPRGKAYLFERPWNRTSEITRRVIESNTGYWQYIEDTTEQGTVELFR